MYTLLPLLSTEIYEGPFSVALVASPPSPLAPIAAVLATPVPAKVVMMLVVRLTRLTLLLSESPMYKYCPLLSIASPYG